MNANLMHEIQPTEARELAGTVVPRTAIFQNGLGAWSVMLTDVELAKLLSMASTRSAVDSESSKPPAPQPPEFAAKIAYAAYRARAGGCSWADLPEANKADWVAVANAIGLPKKVE
jgi:hypothetical protein